MVAHLLANDLSARLGVPFLVEHHPGAGGALAMRFLARARPDGYTLCFSAITPLTSLPFLSNVGYTLESDIAPVVGVMFTPALVVGRLSLEGDTLAKALAVAKQNEQALRWATTGVGTTGHLILEHVRRSGATDIIHLPKNGGGQQLTDLLGGHVDLLSTNVGPSQVNLVREGRLCALGVGSPARVGALPSVPTLAEQGFSAANLGSSFGIFAPRTTRGSVLARINEEVNRSLNQEAIRSNLEAVNNVVTGSTVSAFERQIVKERASFELSLRQR